MDVVVVDSEPVPTRADFRVTAEDTQEVAGLEERNPNIFIYRIDLTTAEPAHAFPRAEPNLYPGIFSPRTITSAPNLERHC